MPVTFHPSITAKRVCKAVEDDNNAGFCLHCGKKSFSCEPDARNYKCSKCGKEEVYGAEEILFMM